MSDYGEEGEEEGDEDEPAAKKPKTEWTYGNK